MEAKEISQWRDEEALRRYTLIAPLTDPELDPAERSKLRQDIVEKYSISERTLFRYEKMFREQKFEGLKPVSPLENSVRGQGPFPGFEEVLKEAIQLKREVPLRSVNQIIFILEGEGKVKHGLLKRPTLQRYLYKAGYGRTQMKKYDEARGASSRRFCKPHRMMLAQADIKYVMKLPLGRNGTMVQCYICALVDDHSRYILASGVYDHQDADIVEDVYKRAILSYGTFTATYVDNGKQFVSDQLIRALSRLGIRHIRARPYACQSKGKIEVYNRLINSYIAECKAKKVKTLEEANRYWQLFVDEYYHMKAHEGIAEYYESLGREVPEEGITPQQEFNRDTARLCFLDAKVVTDAFLHRETRTVDKGACFSFRGRKYDAGQALIGAKVEIAFDPMAPETVTVHYEGMTPFEVKPLQISEFCGKKPELPERMQSLEPETSRFLDLLEQKHGKSLERHANAISYASLKKDGEGNV